MSTKKTDENHCHCPRVALTKRYPLPQFTQLIEALFAMTGREAGKARAVTHWLLTVHRRSRHAAV